MVDPRACGRRTRWNRKNAMNFEGMSKPEGDLTREQYRNGRVLIILVAKDTPSYIFMVLMPHQFPLLISLL